MISQISGRDLAKFALRNLSTEEQLSLVAKVPQLGQLSTKRFTLTLEHHVAFLDLRLKLQHDPKPHEVETCDANLWLALRNAETSSLKGDQAVERLTSVYNWLHGR